MKLTDTDRNVRKLLRDQGYLITRSQAMSAGLTTDAVRHRTRVGGPWTSVLPGVYVAGTGMLATGQKEIAASLYAGPQSVITGLAALLQFGIKVPDFDYVDLLVPAANQRQSTGFARLHRTTRIPGQPWVAGGLRCAPPARAVADAVRGKAELRDVRALVSSAVQRNKCTIAELSAELRLGPRRGSGGLRAALEEVIDGIRSGAEGDLRQLIKVSGLPMPMFNPRLYLGSMFLAQPDAWWPDAGLAAEVDSREWHSRPSSGRPR